MGNAGTKAKTVPAGSEAVSPKADGANRGSKAPPGSDRDGLEDPEEGRIIWGGGPSDAKVGREKKGKGGEVVRGKG